MRWQDRISVNPNVCHGKPCIKGTRVLVSVVLADVAVGEPFETIMTGYHIEREDIQACSFSPPTWLRIVMSSFPRRAEMHFKNNQNLLRQCSGLRTFISCLQFQIVSQGS